MTASSGTPSRASTGASSGASSGAAIGASPAATAAPSEPSAASLPSVVPSVRTPALAIAAVVVTAVLGAVVLLLTWPDDADRAATGPGTSTVGAADTEEETEAAVTATAVLRAWSRPGLAYPWWWDGLRPLLGPGARAAYAHTDPDQLPQLGELRVVEERLAPTTATVWFRTDAGRFGVDLARADEDGDWHAQRILFPGQDSVFS